MHLDSFITSALLVLIATSIAVTLFKYLHLGSVLGLLVAGIIVGPHSVGPVVTEHVEDVRHFTELGVVLLLFLIGLEMKPSRLWAMRRDVLGLGSLQILLSGLAIGAYFMAYQQRWEVALLIGMTFALSSTAFVLQLLQERGEIASKHGTTAFSVLLMQDMAIVPLLAIVPLMSISGGGAGARWEQLIIITAALVLLGAFGRYVIPFALTILARQRNKEGFLLVVILAVIFAAWAMHLAGASMALGAFIMGVSLSGCRYRHQIQASIEPFKGILLGLFFVAVGMSIDFRALAVEITLFAQHTAVIISLKIIVLFILVMAFGYTRNIAIRVSLLLAQGGEFGFVLFASAKALHVIDDSTFIHAIGIISVSMLLTPVMAHLASWLSSNVFKQDEDRGTGFEDSLDSTPIKKVIIGGYGRVGHAVAVLLQQSGVPFVAFDTNYKLVKRGQEEGFPVYYGDIGDLDLLITAHTEHAMLVILTIDHGPTAERAVSHIRNSFPSVPVIARAHDLASVGRLVEAGATHAYPEALESSLRLGALALQILNIPEDNVDLLIKGVRSDHYKLVEQDERGGGG